VTASFAQPETATPRGPNAVVGIAVGMIGAVSVLVLLVAGLTFVGLAIAFPIAVPIAAAYALPISATDAALAEQFAAMWWAFGALAIASFVAAGVIVVKLIGFLSPTPRD
jgi:hypothetical protein